MLMIFDQRAKGLRKYVFDLMTQKQTELELIREEFAPRYELLKEKRARGQIGEEAYRDMVEKLGREEAERRVDVEIEMGELEQKMEEEMGIRGMKHKNEVEQ